MNKKTIIIGIISVLLVINMMLTYSCLKEIENLKKYSEIKYDSEAAKNNSEMILKRLDYIDNQLDENSMMLSDVWVESAPD